MSNIKVLETDRDTRAENAIAMLEGVIERIRAEGVSQVSVFYCPLGPGSSYADFFSDDVKGLVGSLEIMKHDALSFRRNGE